MRMTENIIFQAHDKNPKHVYYREMQSQNRPQKVWPGDSVTGELKKDYRTSNRLAYQSPKTDGKTIGATLAYEMERVFYNSDQGVWVLDLGYKFIKNASITLEALPSGATAWLMDSTLAGKLISECKGTGTNCTLISAKRIDRPRLVISGAKPQDAYAPGIVTRFTEASVTAQLHEDSTFDLLFDTSPQQEGWAMPILNESETFLGSAKGYDYGHFERYAMAAYLHAAPGINSMAATIAIHNPKIREAGAFTEFAIGTLDTASRNGNFKFSSEPSRFTEYKSVKITLPSDKPVLAEILRCKDNWTYSYQCEPEHRLLSEFKQVGHEVNLTLLEPAMHPETVIRLYHPAVYLQDTGASKLLQYQIKHYLKFGHKPGWAYFVHILFYLVLLVAAVIALVKMIGYVRQRARSAKELKQFQATEAAALREILQRDPNFNLEAFRTRGKEIATHIQHSWCAGDMRDCRRYLSQGVYNRFRLQIKIMREIEKRKNVMADFEIRRFYVLAHNSSGDFDCLTVRMDAAARDLMVEIGRDEDESLQAARRAPLTPFSEFYSFMRRRDAKTEHREAFDTCSHCGTPFKGEGELNKCKSCGAISGSGTFDWVLAEITQYSEYRGNTARKNLNGLSSDRIEDRASFVFWRDLMAGLTGNRDYIVRDASENYLATESKPQSLYDIAVGAADLESFKSNSAESIAKVRIKWSAAAREGTEVRHRQSVVTLKAANAVTSTAGFAEHGCASCGAPLPETDSIECSYCHSPIQRKNADWLLDSVETTVE